MLLEESVCYDQCVLLENYVSVYTASFFIPRPKTFLLLQVSLDFLFCILILHDDINSYLVS